MRAKLLGLVSIIGLMVVPTAYAGHGSGYTQSQESGVTIYRGHHGAAYSAGALEMVRLRKQREAAAKQAEETAYLARQLAVQSVKIEALGRSIDHHTQDSHRSKRRRTYYGNPAFFGRNGFIGNRHFGGATIAAPRRRHYPRPYK